jgi:hypothetical protein
MIGPHRPATDPVIERVNMKFEKDSEIGTIAAIGPLGP